MFVIQTIFLLFISPSVFSQDLSYAREVLLELTSERFKGRGYVGNGDLMAAKYIAKQFKKNGAKPFGENGYFQPYRFAINSFPSKMELKINNKLLTSATDYLVLCNSPTTEGTFKLVWCRGDDLSVQTISKQVGNVDLSDKFLVIPKYNRDFVKENNLNARGIICLSTDKRLTWGVSNGKEVAKYTTIILNEEKIDKNTKSIQLDFTNKFLTNHKANNVLSYVPGTQVPDSFIVFTAHYDHLGKMGKKACFYGANDNASGTSMVLDLSRHYSQNPSRYSIVFITFSGEEVGLLGSKYCAENPPFDLSRIKFLINLDMVGTGSEGVTVVNAGAFKKEYNLMKSLNSEHGYLPLVKYRGESCNSDHCPFYQKGVPSFFIYAIGKEYTEYHSIYDRGPDLPFTAYCNIVKLLLDFTDEL
jgi:aminopeptidase YwaD